MSFDTVQEKLALDYLSRNGYPLESATFFPTARGTMTVTAQRSLGRSKGGVKVTARFGQNGKLLNEEEVDW